MGRHDTDWGAGAAAGVVLLAAVAFVALLALLLTATVATTKELGRIYAARALGQHTSTARFLWTALVVLFLLWLAAALLAAALPTLTSLAVYTAAWSLGGYLVAVEVADYLQQRREQGQLTGMEQLDTYLTEPFAPASPALPAPNGQQAPSHAGAA